MPVALPESGSFLLLIKEMVQNDREQLSFIFALIKTENYACYFYVLWNYYPNVFYG